MRVRESSGLLLVLALACVLLCGLLDWLSGSCVMIDGKILDRSWSPRSSTTAFTYHGNGEISPTVITHPESLSFLVEGDGRTLSVEADVEQYGHLRPGDRVKAIEIRGWSGIVYRRGLVNR